MFKQVFSAAFLCVAAFAQTASPLTKNPFDKPPADVDDALRARVKEFYQLHMTGKYRLAEQLVAEDSKDGFYAAGKPDIKDFSIGDIAYSDGYAKAKVTVVAKMLMTFMGMAAAKMMDVPFPSYWKLENGKWCWYIFNDPNRMTPFGKINPQSTSATADPSMAFRPVDLSAIATAVKADRTAVKLGDGEEKVIISNSLPGAVTLALDEMKYPGIEAKLDKAELKAGEKAVVTLRATSTSGRSRVMVGVIVQPTNQLIQIEVK